MSGTALHRARMDAAIRRDALEAGMLEVFGAMSPQSLRAIQIAFSEAAVNLPQPGSLRGGLLQKSAFIDLVHSLLPDVQTGGPPASGGQAGTAAPNRSGRRPMSSGGALSAGQLPREEVQASVAKRLSVLGALFDSCDSTGTGLVAFEHLAMVLGSQAARAGSGAAEAGAAAPKPFRLVRTLRALPGPTTGGGRGSPAHGASNTAVEDLRARLGVGTSARRCFALPSVNLLATTDSRNTDVTLLSLDTLGYAGTLRMPSANEANQLEGGARGGGGGSSSGGAASGANVDACVPFFGIFPDGSVDESAAFLATACSDSTISLFDVSLVGGAPSCAVVNTWSSMHPQSALSYNQRFNILYSGCSTGAVRGWDCVSGTQKSCWSGHSDGVLDIALLDSVDAVASGSLDTKVKVRAA